MRTQPIGALNGRNVASNTGFEINAGAYFRPIDSNGDQLQIGINANMQAYDKNLRFFSASAMAAISARSNSSASPCR
ncbi:cellulose synthase subunit BcsC-related outer membrane protein [Caulobacter segnis]